MYGDQCMAAVTVGNPSVRYAAGVDAAQIRIKVFRKMLKIVGPRFL